MQAKRYVKDNDMGKNVSEDHKVERTTRAPSVIWVSASKSVPATGALFGA